MSDRSKAIQYYKMAGNVEKQIVCLCDMELTVIDRYV
jgi:hypothetical protein